MLVCTTMRIQASLCVLVCLLWAPTASLVQSERRYRVEQTVQVETTSAEPVRVLTWTLPEPVSTRVEGRVVFILVRRGQGDWQLEKIELAPMRAEPSVAANAPAATSLAAALVAFAQQEGKTFWGDWRALPVLGLGEGKPAWLSGWLQWAQAGLAAPAEADPLTLVAPKAKSPTLLARYVHRRLRSDFRQEVCGVEQVRWLLPAQATPSAVSAELATAGIEARTHFAAESLEWLGQQSGELIYAERSAVRETFWDLEKVTKPGLRQLGFRYRLGVTLRVERLP